MNLTAYACSVLGPGMSLMSDAAWAADPFIKAAPVFHPENISFDTWTCNDTSVMCTRAAPASHQPGPCVKTAFVLPIHSFPVIVGCDIDTLYDLAILCHSLIHAVCS